MKVKDILAATVFVVIACMVSCTSEKNYDPDKRLEPKEEAAITAAIVRYASKKPENIDDAEKFDAKYDTFYREKASKIRLEQYYPKGEDFYFLISQQAPSLVEKRNATGGRFRLNDTGELIEYEEIFRTWKMVPDTLKKRSYFLFDKMVKGEPLDKWYTKNSGGTDFIEFPDDQTRFDIPSRTWVLKQ
jgi:hypothetical protein